MRCLTLVALAWLAGAPVLAADDAVQSPSSIESAVRDFVTGQGGDEDREITIGRIDPRLRLALCERPLATRFAHGPAGNGPANPVEVRCTGGKPWSIYVGVNIVRHANVVVATHAIARGAVLAPGDVTIARRPISGTQMDFLTDAGQAVGQVAARAIAAQQVLGAANVKMPRLVKRGDEVTIASSGGAISVRMRGKALGDGALGERVSVRNLSSSRVVEGVVSGDGTVVVATGGAVL